MRAALVSEYRTPAALGERDEPQPAEGSAVVELRAAGLNPADVAIASGSFPAGSPALPYVPGIEAVGTVVASARFPARTRVDDVHAAALGVVGLAAWMPLAWLSPVRPGEARRIRVDVEAIPLERVDEAWRRQAQGAGAKLVLVP